MIDVEWEVVAEGLAFPEGPVVLSDGSVLFVEIVGGTVKRWWVPDRIEVVARPGGGPNGAQLGPDGALYICNNGGIDWANQCHANGPGTEGRIERVDLATGRVERVYERCGDALLSAPNDLVFDRSGGLWFTDLGKHLARISEVGGLYYCRPDGSQIGAAYSKALSYNGVGLSPDERSLYVADTHSARLWRFDLDDAGQLADRRPPTWVATGSGDVTFDSLGVTQTGAVCVGTIGRHGGGVTQVSPDGSSKFLSLPDQVVTNIAFGGPDMRTAFITLAETGRLVRARWPAPGLRLNFAL